MTHDPVTEKSPAQQSAAAVAADAFGLDLYRRLAAHDQDLVFSPASIAAALQLALLGARGSTAEQLAAALHLDQTDPAAGAEAGLRLLSEVIEKAGANAGATLRAPNTLWVQAGLPLEPGYTRQLQGAAAAAIEEADFSGAPQQARAAINALIAEQTAGKITNLLGRDAVTAATRLVLANAVYLKARWAFPFTAAATKDAPFHPGDGAEPITVAMMHRTASLPYVRGHGYQAVLLPYRDVALAMAVLLPDGPLAALRPKVAAAGLGGLLAGTAMHQVALSLPRFRLEAAFDLIPALQRLGVTEAFGADADFGGITSAEPLQIGAVAHKAYIDVDERGTEAAAATAVVIRTRAAVRPTPPVTMVVDRPFLFAIVDTSTSLPVFLGQVTRPGPG